MKCRYCEKEEVLPFRCPFCGGYFCTEHRLPENHACPERWRAKAQGREPTPTVTEEAPSRIPHDYTRTPFSRPTLPRKPVFRFSPAELVHLALGMVLVMGVGMSIFVFTWIRWPWVGILAAVFTSSFLLHELAHKLTAQLYGLWAEFRLTLTGVLITLISMIPLSPIKIISPGAVMIAGYGSKETIGKISVAGPLTNLLLSILFTGISLITHGIAGEVAVVGGFFNALIVLFNILPLWLLDGWKVFRWNKAVWGVISALSIVLLAWTSMQSSLL